MTSFWWPLILDLENMVESTRESSTETAPVCDCKHIAIKYWWIKLLTNVPSVSAASKAMLAFYSKMSKRKSEFTSTNTWNSQLHLLSLPCFQQCFTTSIYRLSETRFQELFKDVSFHIMSTISSQDSTVTGKDPSLATIQLRKSGRKFARFLVLWCARRFRSVCTTGS